MPNFFTRARPWAGRSRRVDGPPATFAERRGLVPINPPALPVDPFARQQHTRELLGFQRGACGPMPGWWHAEQAVLRRLAAETALRGPAEAARAVFGRR